MEFHIFVPINYCNYPLNQTDCGLRPVPVFTYYRPGSRCEIEFWRGCPTYNKFDDEYQCSHHCIGRLNGPLELPNLQIKNNIIDDDTPECFHTLNIKRCTSQNITVYTFDETLYKCIKKSWYGCDSKNKFIDKKSCYQTCDPDWIWKKTLKGLPIKAVQDMNKVLDSILTDIIISTEAIKMKLIVTEATTATTTEPARDNDITRQSTFGTTTSYTKEPMHTTKQTTHTTEESTLSTGEMTLTTAESTSTTEESMSTTEKPMSTTEESTSTTEESTSTTEKPMSTTEESTSTTEKSTSTTEESTSTTQEPTSTEKTTTLTPEPGDVEEVITS